MVLYSGVVQRSCSCPSKAFEAVVAPASFLGADLWELYIAIPTLRWSKWSWFSNLQTSNGRPYLRAFRSNHSRKVPTAKFRCPVCEEAWRSMFAQPIESVESRDDRLTMCRSATLCGYVFTLNSTLFLVAPTVRDLSHFGSNLEEHWVDPKCDTNLEELWEQQTVQNSNTKQPTSTNYAFFLFFWNAFKVILSFGNIWQHVI